MSLWSESRCCRGRRGAAPAGRRGQSARLSVAVALVAGLLLAVSSSVAAAFTLPVTGPPNAPRMVFDRQMKVVPICLPVTNPAAGQSLLYGQRFTDGPAGTSTPAIVLVHGIASSTQAWDVSPTWSVARAQIGRDDWYVLAGTARRGVLKVRGGIIQEVGLASPPTTHGRAAQRRLLTSFTAP